MTTFPDASTTGVPAGTSLTSVDGHFNTSYAGQVIDALDVSGQIIINHPGVIVRNSQAQHIVVFGDGATIEDSTVTGQNAGGSGIVLLGGNATVQRNDVSGVENGIWLESNGNLIADNYVHDLRNDVYFDPHFDGLQVPPGTSTANNTISHNNFDLALNANACIMLQDATNIAIDNNRLHGGTYTIYLDYTTSGVAVTNNVYAGYVFGTVAGTAAEAQSYSGNVDGDTAVSTSPPPATTSPPPTVTAEGNDQLFGTDNDDTILAFGGDDVVRGRGGNDLLGGGSGSDTLRGELGNDGLDGGDGSDQLFGGAGDDILVGEADADLLEGGSGRDLLLGGIEGDVLLGQDGDDLMGGGANFDFLDGGSGNDGLDGGDGSDQLFGGAGDDTLVGDGGNDTMTGGSGADEFVFQAFGNTDVVTDFTIGVDHIRNTSGVSTATLVATATVTDGGSTIIHLVDGTQMVIAGQKGIDASWFV